MTNRIDPATLEQMFQQMMPSTGGAQENGKPDPEKVTVTKEEIAAAENDPPWGLFNLTQRKLKQASESEGRPIPLLEFVDDGLILRYGEQQMKLDPADAMVLEYSIRVGLEAKEKEVMGGLVKEAIKRLLFGE